MQASLKKGPKNQGAFMLVHALLNKERHTVWINHVGVYYQHDVDPLPHR